MAGSQSRTANLLERAQVVIKGLARLWSRVRYGQRGEQQTLYIHIPVPLSHSLTRCKIILAKETRRDGREHARHLEGCCERARHAKRYHEGRMHIRTLIPGITAAHSSKPLNLRATSVTSDSLCNEVAR